MVSRIHSLPSYADALLVENIPLKLLILGTCAVHPLLIGLQHQGIAAEHILWESLQYSPEPEVDPSSYDGYVVALTLTHIFYDAAHAMEPNKAFGNAIYLARAIELGKEEEYFRFCVEYMHAAIDRILRACVDKPLFFLSFAEPQHNYLGNLMPRYSLSNPAQFIRKLNEAMAARIEKNGAHFFDTNEIRHLVGSAGLQDDYTTFIAHGGVIGDDPNDARRIQETTPPLEAWGTFEALVKYENVLARRFLDNMHIIRRPLSIKAIIVDADDTLWRGIAVEEPDKPVWEFLEGWPLGFAEALLFFKARGGMLALCSKNDPNALRSLWGRLYAGKLRLADFASIKINFERKSENIRSILKDLNILPQNVLFIDDNPREIDEVRAIFPDMQFLTADHHDWRRKILTSPATQAATISADAKLRTASI